MNAMGRGNKLVTPRVETREGQPEDPPLHLRASTLSRLLSSMVRFPTWILVSLLASAVNELYVFLPALIVVSLGGPKPVLEQCRSQVNRPVLAIQKYNLDNMLCKRNNSVNITIQHKYLESSLVWFRIEINLAILLHFALNAVLLQR